METETTATDSIDAEDLDPVLAPSDLLDADGRAVYAVAVAASDDGSTIYLINVGDSVAQGEPTLELAVHNPEESGSFLTIGAGEQVPKNRLKPIPTLSAALGTGESIET